MAGSLCMWREDGPAWTQTQIRFLHEELLDSDDMPFYDEVHRCIGLLR